MGMQLLRALGALIFCHLQRMTKLSHVNDLEKVLTAPCTL